VPGLGGIADWLRVVVSKGRFRRELGANMACAGLPGKAASPTATAARAHQASAAPASCSRLGFKEARDSGVPQLVPCDAQTLTVPEYVPCNDGGMTGCGRAGEASWGLLPGALHLLSGGGNWPYS